MYSNQHEKRFGERFVTSWLQNLSSGVFGINQYSLGDSHKSSAKSVHMNTKIEGEDEAT